MTFGMPERAPLGLDLLSADLSWEEVLLLEEALAAGGDPLLELLEEEPIDPLTAWLPFEPGGANVLPEELELLLCDAGDVGLGAGLELELAALEDPLRDIVPRGESLAGPPLAADMGQLEPPVGLPSEEEAVEDQIIAPVDPDAPAEIIDSENHITVGDIVVPKRSKSGMLPEEVALAQAEAVELGMATDDDPGLELGLDTSPGDVLADTIGSDQLASGDADKPDLPLGP